jgi:protein-S-isoprenylcysteine O-methyltransferase Ste14
MFSMTEGEGLYLAGLVFAEALRLQRRVERLRPSDAAHVGARQSRAAEQLVLGSVLIGLWVLPLVTVLTPWLGRFDVPLPRWAAAAGAALFCASLALRWLAQKALGRQWSHTLETAAAQTLVMHGVYARLRHPLYVSLVLWALAQPLLLQNAVSGFAGAVAVGLIWLIRVPREEAMLIEHFGEEYRSYMSRTGRLFPRRR